MKKLLAKLRSIVATSRGFLRKHKFITPFLLFLLLVFGVQLGLFFITDRIVSYNSKEYSGSTEEVAGLIAQDAGTITLVHGNQELSQEIEPIGVSVNEDLLNDQLDKRRSALQLVPIFGLFSQFDSVEVSTTYDIDEDRLEKMSEELAAVLSYDPVDAGLKNSEGQLEIVAEKQGSLLRGDVLYRTLKAFFESPETTTTVVTVQGQATQPEVSAADLETVVETYEQVLTSELTVQIDDDEYTLGPDELLKLLAINNDSIEFDEEAAKRVVSGWTKDIVKTAGTTTVTYVDDIETERNTGKSGQSVDVESLLSELESWFESPEDGSVISATSFTVPANVVEKRSYTDSSAGLRNAIETWDKNNPGTYRVFVQEIGGESRSAGLNQNTSTVMASTYKTFLSVVAYRLAESSELSLSTKIYGSSTVEDCIRVGMIQSDNACMVALGKFIGWERVDEIIAGLGFSNTTLNNYNSDGSFNGDKRSTASDEALLLQRLVSGTLLSDKNASKLRGYMAQDIYTTGIPAGSAGSKVEHKVGFLSGLKHDMGIVYGPESTYVLVILSDNASWSQVADLSSVIYEFLN